MGGAVVVVVDVVVVVVVEVVVDVVVVVVVVGVTMTVGVDDSQHGTYPGAAETMAALDHATQTAAEAAATSRVLEIRAIEEILLEAG